MRISDELTSLEGINTLSMLTCEHDNCPLQQSFIYHPGVLYFLFCGQQTHACEKHKRAELGSDLFAICHRITTPFVLSDPKNVNATLPDYKSASGLQSDYRHGALENVV